MGGKYFGHAFLNRGDIFPSSELRGDGKKISAFLEYKPTTTKAPSRFQYWIFSGPKSLKQLSQLDEELKEWINFGMFDFLARPLLTFLKFLYSWFGNWGWAIVLLTLFIRLCLLPLNFRSYKSMKVMQKIQPQIQELRKKHEKDAKKLNQEVLGLMKENRANPLGGCLPLFLQFPLFFALYRVLGESVELYQAPFIFWLKDLSLYDPFYILPLLGGGTLFVQQKITPTNMPPAQARILAFMPLLFVLFMLQLPSGLTLYIFISSLFGLIQQAFFVKAK